MAEVRRSKHCKYCGRKTLHSRVIFSAGWGIFLSIVTAGLFLPVWFLLVVAGMFSPYRCQTCGST